MLTFCAATVPLDPTDLVDLYWAGRTSLITRHDDIAVYDECSARSSWASATRRGAAPDHRRVPQPRPRRRWRSPRTEQPARGATTTRSRARAAGVARRDAAPQVVRRRAPPTSWPRCAGSWRGSGSPAAAAHPPHPAAAARAPPRPAPHRARSPAHPRRARRQLRWRRRRRAAAPAGADPRRVRLDGRLLARAAAVRPLGAARRAVRVEVFCFGTRLTRITPPCGTGSPDDALAEAAELVVDWEGGTRIGDVARRVRARLGPARHRPRRRRGHLLRRPRPRRPGHARDRDGTAVPALPPRGLVQPARAGGRRRYDGRRAAHRPWCWGATSPASRSSPACSRRSHRRVGPLS